MAGNSKVCMEVQLTSFFCHFGPRDVLKGILLFFFFFHKLVVHKYVHETILERNCSLE